MTATRFDPPAEALAYRAAMWCRTHGWEHTLAEVAAAVGVSVDRLRGVAQGKGWTQRFRSRRDEHGRTVNEVTASDQDMRDFGLRIGGID